MRLFFSRWFRSCLFLGIFLFCPLAGKLWAQSSPIVFNTNAGWNWCQDERAIICNNQFIFGSTADASGTDGATRDGDDEITTYNLSTSQVSVFTLHDALDSDDHAPPALMVRPDGKILAVYCTHGHDGYVRWRITSSAGDTSNWSAESTVLANSADGWGATYTNLYRLSSTGITYDFFRGEWYNPNVLTSTDNGSSWSYAGRLIRTSASGIRPYIKAISNNTDRIWFTYTQHHPRNDITNLYAMYLQGGIIYDSYGTQIGVLNTTSTSGISPSQGTVVFNAAAHNNNRAWTSDLQLDAAGNPVAVYSVRVDNNDHRYRFARFNGTTWTDNEIAYAGQCLYTAENDYTGLIAFNPSDLNTVYMSTNADPVSGAPLISSADNKRHWEVYRGFTNNNGVSFTWTPITANSTSDNIRPNLPIWDNQHSALYWLQGTYTTYTDYNLDAVGYVFSGANGIWSNSGGGDWAGSGNWQSGLVASGKLGVADFSTLDVSGTVSVQLNAAQTLGTLVFGDTNEATPGNWTLNPGSGGSLTLENIGVARPAITVQNQSATINLPLAGTQGLEKNGNGALVLNYANTYSGDTAITGGTLKTNTINVIPYGSGKGNVAISSGATLDLNGYNQSINGLSGAGTVDNTVAGSATLTVGGNDISSKFEGKIQNTAGTLGLNKIGNGTLTILGTNNTYSGATTISQGIVKLGERYSTFITTKGVTHRWSFNNSLADSVGTSHATIVDVGANNVTLSSTQATMTGGARSSSDYIQLGTDLLPNTNTAITIELWATPQSIKDWSRIFDFGSSDSENLFMSWTQGTNLNTDKVGWKHGSTYDWVVNSNQPYNLGTEYHIVMTLAPSGSSTQVSWYSTASGNANLGAMKGTFTTTNTLANLLDSVDNLGRSSYSADGTANASYNEFRMWVGALDSTTLETLHDAGTDADLSSYTEGYTYNYITSGNLPSTTALNLSGSGATLDLNGFNQTVASLTGVAGSSVLLGSGTLTAGGDDSSTTFSGAISGSGGIIKTGTGTLTLTQALTDLTQITVMDGVLETANINLSTGSVNVQSGGAELITDSLFASQVFIGSESRLVILGSSLSESLDVTPTPEPATWIMLVCGGIWIASYFRRKK